MISIVLIHINCNDPDLYCLPGLPAYVEDCLQQVRLFNKCDIYFLTNESNTNDSIFKKYNIKPIPIEDLYDIRIETFSKYFYNDGFWNAAASRLFYIENFMRKYNLEDVLHFENDILIYEDLLKYDYRIFSRLAITPGSDKECMTGMFYIKNVSSLNIFTEYMLNVAMSPDRLKLKYNIDYNLNEMNILSIYSKELGKEYLDYFPILPVEHSYNLENFNSIFDPATFGQFIGGSRTENTGVKPNGHYISKFLTNDNIKFEYVEGYLKPFFFYEDKKFLINNLHIHSKKLHLYKSRKRFDYIQGEKFMNLASDDIIYSHTHYVNNILKNPPKNDFILITHNGDAKVTDNIRIHSVGVEDADINLIPNNLKHWYGQNIDIQDNKIESIPIGLENSYNFPELKKIEKLENLSRTVKIEDKLLYVNFNIDTNVTIRKPIYDFFRDKNYATLKNGVNGFDYDQYLIDLYEHKFVICPEGNGIDTHRTWECLYLGTIPIEKRNINNQFYTDLPICFVDNWEDITEEFLNSEYIRIKTKRWNLEKLDFNFWKNKIIKMESKSLNVNEIYEKYVKVNDNFEYLNRYNTLPLEFNNKNWKWEGKDFPRVIALLEFKKFMEKNNNHFNNVLSFNGSHDPEYEYINYSNITNYNYLDDRVHNDLHKLNLDKKDFDFVMLNQVIEHLYDPITCLKNIYNHLKKGAIFYANLPVNNIPHDTPEHYYTGITPVGLGVMVELAGFEILEIGQWGNVDYLQKMFTVGWQDYNNVIYKNEINCPIITWIFAKK